MIPTDAQVKEFWEWCGFKRKVMKLPAGSGMGQKCQSCSESSPMRDCDNCDDRKWADTHVSYYHEERWNYPGSEGKNLDRQKIYVPTHYLPPIDLNNLFKFAMTQLDQSRYYKALSSIFLKENASALTLFWAIYEIIKEQK